MNTELPLLISNPVNIRYLTGFAGVEPRDAYILLLPDTMYFFTNPLYREQAKNLSPVIVSREHPLSKALSAICLKEQLKSIAFEDTDLTVSELRTLTDACTGVSFVPAQNRIEQQRMIKRTDETEHIRTACTLTDSCFTHIISMIREGMTESHIAWEIQTFFRKHGASDAFLPIVAFGSHTSQPHYQSDGTELKSGDSILLDFGARVNGYCSDMTRMIFTGIPEPETVRVYNILLSAQKRAVSLLSQGERSGRTLDTAARDTLKSGNLPYYPHSLGHGLGLDIHESPRLSYVQDAQLKPGMVITVEPGVYLEGGFGMRIEDTVHITEHGCDVLTKSLKEFVTIPL